MGKTPSLDKPWTVLYRAKASMWKLPDLQLLGWGTDFEWKGRREKVWVRLFLKGHISPSENPQKSTDLEATKSWWFISSGNVAFSHPAIENVSIHQITTVLINSWQVNYSFQIIYMWPFILLPLKSLSHKKFSIRNKAHSEQFCLRSL